MHTISRELRAKLELAEFWGLLFDGSEDITNIKQEIVYIASVSSNREFTLDSLGLIELGADRTAQNITEGHFQDTGLDNWKTKLVSWNRRGCCQRQYVQWHCAKTTAAD